MQLSHFARLKGKNIHGVDGEVGSLEDIYFDDSLWTVRYIVVKTGNWLKKREVLISPVQIEAFKTWKEGDLSVNLTQDQIKNAPEIATDRPVSKQYEQELMSFHGYPDYRQFPGIWGYGIYPNHLLDESLREGDFEVNVNRASEDPHLRSAKEVKGYSVGCPDGTMGGIDDFLIDAQTWSIRYVDVDTVKWWPSKHVLLPTDSIQSVNWSERKMEVSLSKEQIKESPPYDSGSVVTRADEEKLYRHYNKTPYWENMADTRRKAS